ncbi:MAG: HAD hydrolase family protein [Muribaculaceae bacterium]|nr:HAD hydrolase family protein [Muribaculaceae bacterium]
MSRIAYDLSLIRAVVFDIDGVLSPAVVPLGDDGVPRRMANLRDGYAMVRAVRTDALDLCIISGADAPGLRGRFSLIGVKDIFLAAGNKLDLLKAWMASRNLAPEEVAYVGDDIPDLPCLLHVGLPVAPADAAHECREAAILVTKAAGGYGVARELLEEILKVKGVWPTTGDIANG